LQRVSAAQHARAFVRARAPSAVDHFVEMRLRHQRPHLRVSESIGSPTRSASARSTKASRNSA
jgi:hypothetical protein